jgi:lysozyme
VNLSAKGAAFIGAFEGFRAQCYDDAAGNCTIGYGHLIHAGRTTAADRAKWGTITRARGLELLEADAAKAAEAVREKIAIELQQPMFDALVSLAYNCGPGCLDGDVGKAVNSRPHLRLPGPTQVAIGAWRKRVENALLEWDRAGGVILAGLKRRRHAEFIVFDQGRYTQATGNSYANA